MDVKMNKKNISAWVIDTQRYDSRLHFVVIIYLNMYMQVCM